MTKSNQGFGDNQSDRERAELRGKGRAPDYEPGSDEGTRQLQEPGQRRNQLALGEADLLANLHAGGLVATA